MPETLFHNRRAHQLENDHLRLTVLAEGGHIAEVYDKRAGISPLWIPHWPSTEPSQYNAQNPGPVGPPPDGPLLAGIMGHNLCLDLFGGPNSAEAAVGMTSHGEASVLPYQPEYQTAQSRNTLVMRLNLPLAQLHLTRTITLNNDSIHIHESIENLANKDRPIGWTQHVTLAPPFLNPATTEFRASMTRSIVSESDPGQAMYLRPGAEFTWPNAPQSHNGLASLEKMHPTAPASGYTAHVADRQHPHSYFIAYEPKYRLAFGYIWKTADFPWMGIWEENCSRTATPWNSKTITRGMEFGVSPFPESRQAMVARQTLLGIPTYRTIPAKGCLEAEYYILSQPTGSTPDKLDWPV